MYETVNLRINLIMSFLGSGVVICKLFSKVNIMSDTRTFYKGKLLHQTIWECHLLSYHSSIFQYTCQLFIFTPLSDTTTTFKKQPVILSRHFTTLFMICVSCWNDSRLKNLSTKIPVVEAGRVILTSFLIWYTWPYML